MTRFTTLTLSTVLILTSCAKFRDLGKDLKLLDDDYRIAGVIENADSQNVPVKVVVAEWDRSTNRVFSGDIVEVTTGGAFLFMVKSPLNQFVAAYADANRDGKYSPRESLWIHRDAAGNPAPLDLGPSNRKVRVRGKLSPTEQVPAALAKAIAEAVATHGVDKFITRQGVRFAVGEKANLDDPRFAATRGENGLWTPATFAIQSGFGIYFLNNYDPSKVPVLFIHGAAGSPQDWRFAMEKLDRKTYQPWFYVYPSGMRLDQAAASLNDAVTLLHQRYAFRRLDVVAHSMGGLVARDFIVRNTLTDGQNYIKTFVSFSSPWDGHEAAAMGVKYAPEVVPSWRDMQHGSGFLTTLYDKRLKGRVNHHLFYSYRASRSPVLPRENDGSVSVASELRKEAQADAVETRGFDEDHVSILSSRDALNAGKKILDATPR
ncbi:MAG: alpha/beta fold hydrolase [Verrucomicrobiota bacterium]